MNYLSTKVGIYKSSRYKHPKTGKPVLGYTFRKAIPLEDLLKDSTSKFLIQKYRETKNPRVKEDILLFTPAGYYTGKRQEKEPLTESTGLVQVDVDGKTNPKIENWPKYRDYLFERYPWIAVCGISCGGQGLFILALTTGWENYSAHFYALAELLEAEEELIIDRAVSSPNELRYMTLNEDIVYRDKAKVFKDTASKPQSKFELTTVIGTGKLVAIPDSLVGKMRRQDVLDYILANLHNGVTRAEVVAYLGNNLDKLTDKTSTVHGDMDAVDYLSVDLYTRYADQFGQRGSERARLSSGRDLSGSAKRTTVLATMDFDKKTTHQEMWVEVVREVIGKYNIFINATGIYKFETTHWVTVARPMMGQFLRECAIEIGVPPNVASTHKFIEGLLKQVEIDAYDDKKVGNRRRLNFQNGALDIDTAKLLPHDPEDYLFYCLQFDYNPKARCPKFDAYFNYVLPSKDAQKTIFSYLGACFSDSKIEKMLCLLGDGGNGKSVLLDVLSGILGSPNVSRVNIDNLASNAQQADNYRLQLENKILNISSESRFKNLDFAVWKQLASGEPVVAHKFHHGRYEISNYARTIYAMNILPAGTEEISAGFFRRLLIVNFEVTIDDKKRNLNLAKEIYTSEAAGVMNRVVAAIAEFKKTGELYQSKESQELVKDLELQHDSVQQWLEQTGLVGGPVTSTSPLLKDVYKQYRFFCEDELFLTPVGKQKFNARLRRVGVECEKNGRGKLCAYRVGLGSDI